MVQWERVRRLDRFRADFSPGCAIVPATGQNNGRDSDMKKSMDPSDKQWFKLDNAALIFPGQNTEQWSNLIRMSVDLTIPIEPERLLCAVKNILPRFPSMNVRLKPGFFWYYLEKNEKEPVIRPDRNNQCLRVKYRENNHFLFRIFYYENRIALEAFHVLTDGYGCAVFLNTLAAEYLRLSGISVSCGGMVFDIRERPKQTELEDSFIKNATPGASLPRGTHRVYHKIGVPMPAHTFHIINGDLPVDRLIARAKARGATVTEYLTAVLLKIYIDFQNAETRRRRDVVIQVPVNGRKFFGSETLRNLSVCYTMRIDPTLGTYTFDELVRQTSLYLRYVNNEKTLGAMFNSNVQLQKSPLLRLLPLFIKNLGINISFHFTAEKTNTALLTNLGRIEIPDDMKPYVKSYIFMPNAGRLNGGRLGVVSYGDTTTISFADRYRETDVEREFFRFLVRDGIPVRVTSNFT